MGRALLLPVDETPVSEKVLEWMLANYYREGAAWWQQCSAHSTR